MRINREDMLELTRRMTVKRSSMTRIAGAYMDRDHMWTELLTRIS